MLYLLQLQYFLLVRPDPQVQLQLTRLQEDHGLLACLAAQAVQSCLLLLEVPADLVPQQGHQGLLILVDQPDLFLLSNLQDQWVL